MRDGVKNNIEKRTRISNALIITILEEWGY